MIKQLFFKADLICESPFAIGNGYRNMTDKDVLTDAAGIPFIPGSSLAGVCRHYLENAGLQVADLFGDVDREEDSRIVFYEAFLTNGEGVKNLRDGVAIDPIYGTAIEGSRFDYEIIESGAVFSFRMMIDMKDDADKEAVDRIVCGMNDGEIRIGSKTARGMGRVKLSNMYCSIITDIYDLLDFSWDAMQEIYEPSYAGTKLYQTYTYDFDVAAFTYIANKATLYCHDENRVVVGEQLKNTHGESVIPGASWAGVFRHRMHRILSEIGYAQNEAFLEKVFGSMQKASCLVFEDSIIKEDHPIHQTRTAIDRFTGSAGDKKLFTHRLSVGGMVTLTVHVKKNCLKGDEQALLEQLLTLCVQDIHDGLVSVGGQGSIGGGRMKRHGEEQA